MGKGWPWVRKEFRACAEAQAPERKVHTSSSMEAKGRSKGSSRGVLKAAAVGSEGSIPRAGTSGEGGSEEQDKAGKGLTLESLGGRLLELEALLGRQVARDGSPKQTEEESTELGERGREKRWAVVVSSDTKGRRGHGSS